MRDAIAARVTVEQAKGPLTHRHGIEVDEAFQLLHMKTRRAERGLHELADDAVHRGERLDEAD
ncbi:ANTAR domain-containing protein [Curtobacterium sp. PhB146]|uniref:ANTAR domain-containing protein n=1 Tax=Curtobacterium sp. PhB146 TaxID=2485187 RepID=UPI001404ACBA|nr:ANTAR domain-containing protein [Curtobacterium sp. PhB146]